MNRGIFEKAPALRELRPYQIEAIDRLRASLASGKKRPVLQLPTGGGKTVVAGEIIRLAREKGRRVAFCVPALSLIDQTFENFWDHGIRDIGVMQAQHPETDPMRTVQICSVQTLAKRELPKADLVIVDECHRHSEVIEKWMTGDDWKSVPFIGLSATPWAKGMGKLYDDLIVSATTDEMIQLGYLAPFRVFAPGHPDLKGVRVTAGEYQIDDLSDAMSKKELVADIVETWQKRGEDRPTLCFCVDRAHAKHVQEQFDAASIPCGYIDAFTDRGERSMIRDKFKGRSFKVVCNVGVLTTGIDWPEISCIIFARPTRSEMLFVQIAGRGLRTDEGKTDCLFLDHSDNHTRLGFVTDIIHEELDDGKQADKAEKRKAPLPKECPKCSYLRPPRVSTCPNCGFKPQAISHVQHEAGELKELTTSAEKRNKQKKITLHGVDIPQAEFFAQLKGHCAAKGWKPGWASNKYREVFGVWPNAHKNVQAQVPSALVASWIKAQQIRFVKRKPLAAMPSVDADDWERSAPRD